MRKSHGLMGASIALLSGVLGVPGFAATTPSDSDGLQEIVVTAEHRAVDVQRIPISITSISGQEIAQQSRTELDSVLKDVPALQIQASPQGGQIFIRGVGANGDSNYIDPDVALMFDGVYSGRAETVLASMFDVDRVEVLRGPQGTLYGRNAVGGVINIVSNEPVLAQYQAGVNLSGGNYDLFHADGYANLPIGETLAIRIAGDRDTHAGYYSNGGGAANRDAWRLKGLWQPSSSLTVLLNFDYWRYTGLGQTTVPTIDSPLSVYNAKNPWTVSPLLLGPNTFNLLPDQDNSVFATYSLKLNWDLGWGTLTLIPAFSNNDRTVLTQLFAPGPQAPFVWDEKQYTGEARLQSSRDSPITWVGGIYVLNDNETYSGGSGAGDDFIANPTTDHPAKSIAEFAQATVPIQDHLRLTGGLRYTMDKKSLQYGVCTSFIADDAFTCDSPVKIADPATSAYNSGISTYSDKYSALTYKVGMEYDLAERSMLYAQVSSGYKAGGYATTASPPAAYAPEKVTAFEVGSKNRMLDNRLEINAEIYYYAYRNYQVQYATYVPFTNTLPAAYLTNVPAATLAGGEFQQFVANAGDSRNFGGEVEGRFQMTPHDLLNAALTYTDATYGSLVLPTAIGPPGSTTPSGTYSLTGQPTANTPRWIGTAGYQHDWTFQRGILSIRAATKLSSGYYAAVDEWYGGAYQHSYHSTDAYISFRTPDDRWAFGLWGKNLEDGAEKTFVFPFYRAELRDPRTYGGTLSYNFR